MNKRFSLGNMDECEQHDVKKLKKNDKINYPIITALPKKKNFFFRKLLSCSCIYNKKVYDTKN